MAKAFYRRVAELVAAKRNEEYKDIISLTRPKISFALLKSVLVPVGGYRGRSARVPELPISYLSSNLIPEGLTYDSAVPNKP